MRNLEKALGIIASKWDPFMFENGDCHTLAMAIHQASSPDGSPAGRQGTLFACLRKSIDENGDVLTVQYSHMVYSAPSGTDWDIEGKDADERWVERFDLDSTDKWGLSTDLEWVAVPCSHPQYEDTLQWLHEHYGRVNLELQEKLVCVLYEHLHESSVKLAA